MTIPGETVGTGAPGPDQDPNVVGPKVMRSAAGYYIGYGYIDPEFGGHEEPYSRESGYYSTEQAAAADLHSYVPRNTEYVPGGLMIKEYDSMDDMLDDMEKQ